MLFWTISTQDLAQTESTIPCYCLPLILDVINRDTFAVAPTTAFTAFNPSTISTTFSET